jgi:hypothetical protein
MCQVNIERREDLYYLLPPKYNALCRKEESWNELKQFPKFEGREVIFYDVHFPVYIMGRPRIDNNIQVALTGVRKLKDNGTVVWDSLANVVKPLEAPTVCLESIADWA